MQGCNVTVIGGGPAGVLTAAHFAKRGARVAVYEKRSITEQQSPRLGWSIALGDVAISAIEQAGLSADFGPEGLSDGFIGMSGLKPPFYMGGFAKVPPKTKLASHTLTRSWIIRHLREQCAAQYPSLVTFHDGYGLVGGNLAAGEVVLSQPGGTTGAPDERQVRVQADIVVAADGAGSKARSLLQTHDPTLKVKRENVPASTMAFSLDMDGVDPATYVTLETPSGQPFKVFPESLDPKDLKGGLSVFAIPVKGAPPDLVFFIVSCRRAGAEVAGSFTASSKWWAEERTVAEVQTLLEGSFPQVPRAWLRKCAEAYGTPEGRRTLTSSFVECSHLGVGRCAMIGDAAHAVSPNLGYGATAGMADAGLLATTAATVHTAFEGQHAFEGLAGEWTRERLHDAHAYTRLSHSVSDVSMFKIHRNWSRLLAALPLALPHMLDRAPSFPGKGFLAPPAGTSGVMANGGMRPNEVIKAYNASFIKVLGVLGAMIALGATAVAKIGSLLLRAAGL